MSQEQEQSAPTAQNGVLPQMNDDEVLAFTRGTRIKVVQHLLGQGSNGQISGENSDRILLTSMLKDLDAQALSIKKIASDKRNTDSTNLIVAELLRSIDKSKIFTAVPGDDRVIDVSARVVPNSIADVPVLPGEMDVAPAQMDYASFVRSQGKDVDQLGKDVKHGEADDEEGDDDYAP